MRRALPFLLAALVALPLAAAHVEDARPVLQPREGARVVDYQLQRPAATVELSQQGEPLRQWVRHVVDPSRGLLQVEHRVDASDAANGFAARWRLERVLEYRDLNANGFYDEATDVAVKSWRFQNYAWSATEVQAVTVAGTPGKSVVWQGNLSGAPRVRLEAVAAGNQIVDEGAVARPQDVLLYLDLTGLPPRDLNALYVIEGSVLAPRGADVRLHVAENLTASVVADAPGRRAVLVWGGEAVLDGREQAVPATLGEPVVEGDDEARRLRLHVPLTDRSMRFVMVSGVEYVVEAPTPAPGPALAALAAATAAAAARRLRR